MNSVRWPAFDDLMLVSAMLFFLGCFMLMLAITLRPQRPIRRRRPMQYRSARCRVHTRERERVQ